MVGVKDFTIQPSNNIQSLSAVFMIITLATAATNYAFSITNFCATLITPTLLSQLNNGKYSMPDVHV